MNQLNKFHNLSLICLLLMIGLSIGYSMGYYRATQSQFPAIKTVSELNEKISTIQLISATNGILSGKVVGQPARLINGPESIQEINAGESFEIPLKEIDLSGYYQTLNIPEGILFIASKSGKYYYSIFDKQAYQIKMENRLYFTDEESAKIKVSSKELEIEKGRIFCYNNKK